MAEAEEAEAIENETTEEEEEEAEGEREEEGEYEGDEEGEAEGDEGEAEGDEEGEAEGDEEGVAEGDEDLQKENEQLLQELEKGEEKVPSAEEKPKEKPPQSKELKGKIDDKILKQLELVEKEAKEAAEIIYELKTRVEELFQIEQMTEKEEKELEEKNIALKEQMELFEEKTKQIQEIIANTNFLETMPARLPQAKHEEDVLPRVILCGLEDDYVPKIVVCDQKHKATGGGRECMPGCPGPAPPCFKNKPGKSYNSQDKIAAENVELEKIRSRLEEDITSKDKILGELQLKLGSLQKEIQMVSTENAILSEKIRKVQQSQSNKQKQKCFEPKKPCPGVLAEKLQEYSAYTRRLERQLSEMEKDFNSVYNEISEAQKRKDLLAKCTLRKPPCRKR